MYSVNAFEKKLYFNGTIIEGESDNVVLPFAGTLLAGTAIEKITGGVIQYEGFTHTHPDDGKNGDWNWQFSDFIGDQGSAILAGKCYMVDQSGDTYLLDSSNAIAALFDGKSVNYYSGYGNAASGGSTSKPADLSDLKYRKYVGKSGGEVY